MEKENNSLLVNSMPEFNTKSSKKANLILWAIVAIFSLFLIWAYFAKVDEISRGMGQVVPSQRVQIIQNLEGGILSEIAVREGQKVNQDDLLARLENVQAASIYQDTLAKVYENMAAIARLEARIDGSEATYPQELEINPNLISRSDALLQAERNQDLAELNILLNQKTLKNQELAEQEELKKQLSKSLELAQKQRNLAAPLLAQRAYSEIDFVNLEQRVQEISSELSVLEYSLPRLYTELQDVENRVVAHKAEQATTHRTQINTLEAELTSLRENLKAGGDRLIRTDIKSPVNGIVNTIFINTLGGVVRPAEAIMEIVPLTDELIVEAKINPVDIAFIYNGQKAIVKLSAYDFSIYGALEGVVDHISADTLEDQDGTVYYAVKIKTHANTLGKENQNLPILPGMLAQVDIITGKKSILNFLLKPLIKSTQNAFTER